MSHVVFVQAGLGAGGAEKIVNLLASHRVHKGDKVTVLAFYGPDLVSYFPYPDTVTLKTMESDGHSGFRGVKGLLKQAKWLRKELKSLNPDIVVSFLTRVNVVSALAVLGTKRRLLVSERNNPLKQRPNRFWKVLIKRMFRRADHIVMQTKGSLDILDPAARAKATIIANPCFGPKTPPETNRSFGDVVAVGRLTDQKGFDDLIDAFQFVVNIHPSAKLTIWGEGELRSNLEKQVKTLGLSQSVSLPGTTTVPLEWVQTANILALSSRYEGFPNVLAEAMSVGMAVVATDCPWGPSDLIENGENGLLVPVGDHVALAENISRLIADVKLQKELGAAAVKTSKAFRVGNILDQWDSVLET